MMVSLIQNPSSFPPVTSLTGCL
ncbi:hypothetical protein AERO9AM_30210 [Aeromicrobium sp. 9AM]|nr:hypothetical protein AERO9AM_30210 [Aeromicrobium sp. 9AM]